MGMERIFVCYASGSILHCVKNSRTGIVVICRFRCSLSYACFVLDIILGSSKEILMGDKYILDVYSTMPKEQMIPMIATTIAVTLLKVADVTLGILLINGLSSVLQGENKSKYKRENQSPYAVR